MNVNTEKTTRMRPSKKVYYLTIAKVIALRSPCLKMQVGAVLVKDDAIISTGYNGPARGDPHCTFCSRDNKISGSEYTVCPAVHAEENAVINAARQGVSTIGATLYLYLSKPDSHSGPCYRCTSLLKNAGVTEVIM